MPVGAVIGAGVLGAGATVISGAASAKAAGEAADVQAQAALRAEQGITQRFEQTRADLAPWRQTGAQALGQYAGLLGVGAPGAPGVGGPDVAGLQAGLEQYPGYQFALSQGVEAVEKSAAGRGLLQSSQTLKSLTEYGQGLASSNIENYLNRLQGLAGGGQQAAAQTGAFGAQAAGAAGQAGIAAGQARATGFRGQAQALGGTLSGLAGIGGFLSQQPIWGGGGGFDPFAQGGNVSTAQFQTVPGFKASGVLGS